MRVFVAVAPAEHVVEDLDDFLDVRREAGGDLRWSSPAHWHVTLAFMADVPDHALEDLVEGVARAVAGGPAFTAALAGGGCFPDVARARVLWAGVDGTSVLAPLARGVRSACSVAGGSPAGGPFLPHVTLARLPRPIDATRWVRVLAGYRGPSWAVDEVEVVVSHLPRERGHRPRHEVVARLPLRSGTGT